VTLNKENFSPNPTLFTLSTSFWIAYLCFSFFMISLGIYTWYQDKHWDASKQRKDLKAPRIG
jgi:hypothetical protein